MPGAGAASRAAISQLPPGAVGSWIQHDGIETDKRVYVTPYEPHEIEWIRSGPASDETSKFVGGASTSTRSNPRRCHRTSTSSGYSSHSPPLSAGSYSCYASTQDPLYGGLAVIHESETPRPVWLPMIVYRHENRNYEGIYVCRVCGCAYNCSLLPAPFGSPGSVIDDNVVAPPGDIWCNISRVSPGIASRRSNDNAYACPAWSPDGDPPTSRGAPKNSNPINCERYVNPHRLREHNAAVRPAGPPKSKATKCKENSATTKGSDAARGTRGPYIRRYLHGRHHAVENGCAKSPFGSDGGSKECRRALAASTESKYSTLEYGSDVGSSCEETVISANDLSRRLAGGDSGEDLDFTLDVARAERLGRAIARAKRKRQWCRALTVLLGLVFFMLSVIVVSLSVTRGRKMFGSM